MIIDLELVSERVTNKLGNSHLCILCDKIKTFMLENFARDP